MEKEKIQHLEFIQNIINRMNSNSFQIKGWMITIVSALLALFASSDNETYIFVAAIPTLVFWFLDSYYLQQERKYRRLYEDVLQEDSAISPFSLSTKDYKGGRFCLGNSFISPTIALLYGIVFLLLVILYLIFKFGICSIIIIN